MTTHNEKSSLDARLEFLGLDEKARQQLRALAPSISKNIGASLDVFYKKVRSTPETAAFFRNEDHLQGAKKRQEGHWGIVTTAQFDERYVEGVTAVGKAHARIGLEPRWYIGGYALLVEQLIHAVVRERWPSRFARKEGKVLGEEIGVLVKAALLDMDYAITVYLDILAAERKAAEDARAKAEQEQVLALRALSEVLSRLSGGDLEAKLSPEQPENFVGMAQDYNASVEKLRDTIGTVRSAAEEILRSTTAISDASNHLAQRTEQQAAGLEESTAALHELTQNVTLAADGAQKAASVVGIALNEARASGEVVTRAVSAMGAIEKSSDEISKIIGVIDEIAFQTNLLALNAGVEAARAGEAGKGFAVVAHEVRELAQRSANAAKEIKALISKSGEEVADGARYVRDTGKALSTIESEVLTIGNRMEMIAAGAAEQSAAIADVNRAVAGLDQVTQQNASLVERNQEYAGALEQEAARLGGLVSNFRLSADNRQDDAHAQHERVA